jgi:hypothetical protein
MLFIYVFHIVPNVIHLFICSNFAVTDEDIWTSGHHPYHIVQWTIISDNPI